MKKISDYLCKGIEVLLLISISLMVVFTFMQVVFRFILMIPISWSEEAIRLCFIWMIFMGSAIAVREGTHLVLDMLTSQLPAKAQRFFRILVHVKIIICSGILLYGGTDFCIRTWSNSLIALPFPAWSMYISAPIAAVIMLYFAALNLAGEFKPDRKGEN